MRLKFILIMLANILKLTAVSALGGGYYYLTLNRISLKNTYLQSLFVFVQTHRPQYTQPLFKTLLKLNLIEKDNNFSGFTLGGGFDPEGDYIEEIKALGFGGIEIGPASYNASLQQQVDSHLGIMNALAKICTYREKHKKQNGEFRVELHIGPNYQIIKYTPYLLKENLMAALDMFLKIQQRCQYNLVDKITLSFQRADFSLQEHNSEQVQKMINQTKSQGQKRIKTLNENRSSKLSINFTREKHLEWPQLLAYIINKQPL